MKTYDGFKGLSMYGLSSDTIKSIISAISEIQTIEKVVLYGSRAKGNYRIGSDIDNRDLCEHIERVGKVLFSLESEA